MDAALTSVLRAAHVLKPRYGIAPRYSDTVYRRAAVPKPMKTLIVRLGGGGIEYTATARRGDTFGLLDSKSAIAPASVGEELLSALYDKPVYLCKPRNLRTELVKAAAAMRGLPLDVKDAAQTEAFLEVPAYATLDKEEAKQLQEALTVLARAFPGAAAGAASAGAHPLHRQLTVLCNAIMREFAASFVNVLGASGWTIVATEPPACVFGLAVEWDVTKIEPARVSAEDAEDAVYRATKAEVERTWAKVGAGYLHEDDTGALVAYTEAQMMAALRHLNDGAFVVRWTRDSSIRVYERASFVAKGALPGVFNLFRGLQAATYAPTTETAGVALVKDHVLRVICSGDVALDRYIWRWLASMVQHPRDKKRAPLLFLNGAMGAGKDTLSKLMLRVVGPLSAIKVELASQAFGAWTARQRGKVLCVIEEGGRLTPQEAEQLKAQVTADRTSFKEKHAADVEDICTCRFVWTANPEISIPIKDGDRRVLAVRVSDCRVGDGAYFSALHAALDDDGVIGALYQELNEMDLSDFDLAAFPRTDYHAHLRKISRDGYARFAIDLALKPAHTLELTEDELVSQLTAYATKNGHRDIEGARKDTLATELHMRGNFGASWTKTRDIITIDLDALRASLRDRYLALEPDAVTEVEAELEALDAEKAKEAEAAAKIAALTAGTGEAVAGMKRKRAQMCDDF